MSRAKSAKRLILVDDARLKAKRRVPPAVFDYIEGGADSEQTMRENRVAIEKIRFLPRLGVTPGMPAPDLSTNVLGSKISMPVLLAPVGFTRMMDRHGDIAGASSASKAGTIFTLSSMSGHKMTDVAQATEMPAWFQLYYLGGRSGAEQLISSARDAGFAALVVTMDTQVIGNRVRDLRHGITPPLRMNLRNALTFAPQVALHPGWLADFARDRFHLDIVNATTIEIDNKSISADSAFTFWSASPPVWEDFAWIRELWPGPIVVKGVTTATDARRAIDHGAAAIIVSNHGGRQLDGMLPTFRALPDIIEATGDDAEVIVDGGIRRGADVVKAVAMGAKAAMVGRAWAYGLAAAGEAGIDAVLDILRSDIDRTLRLVGCSAISKIDSGVVEFPQHWINRHDDSQ